MISNAEASGTAPAPAAEAPKTTKKATAGARRAHVAPKKGKAGKKAAPTKKAPKGAKKAAGPRDGSKTTKILDLRKRPAGATAKELQKATGWLPHSVRGFLSGTVGKKMKLTVVSTKGEDVHDRSLLKPNLSSRRKIGSHRSITGILRFDRASDSQAIEKTFDAPAFNQTTGREMQVEHCSNIAPAEILHPGLERGKFAGREGGSDQRAAPLPSATPIFGRMKKAFEAVNDVSRQTSGQSVWAKSVDQGNSAVGFSGGINLYHPADQRQNLLRPEPGSQGHFTDPAQFT